tara:strand:+ start:88 stop:1356 length:1269 start_codon:yes stop_codon:yes gene_type:complete
MKITKKSLSMWTFWLSFFSGIPKLLGLVPFQSLNISTIPAVILLLKANKVIYLDCFIALIFLIHYFLTLLFFSSFSGITTFLEFASVILTFIALRTFQYSPSGRSILIYLIGTVIVGIPQLFLYAGYSGGSRGVPLLASEPSRYARLFAVLLVPIFVNWKYLKRKVGVPFLIGIFFLIIFLNRSASLIIPFLVISSTIILLSIDYFKKFVKTLKINKFFLKLYTSFSLLLGLSISYIAYKSRITSFLIFFIKSVFLQGNLLSFLRTFGGRRFSTVFYSYQNGITSLMPNGIDSAKSILNYENLTSSFIGLKPYHERIILERDSFESASFFSHYILDSGFFAFVLSIIFTFTILKMVSKNHLKLVFNKETSNLIKIESALRSSTCYVGLLLLWFYSTNSYIQPWLMLTIGLMPSHISNVKIRD